MAALAVPQKLQDTSHVPASGPSAKRPTARQQIVANSSTARQLPRAANAHQWQAAAAFTSLTTGRTEHSLAAEKPSIDASSAVGLGVLARRRAVIGRLDICVDDCHSANEAFALGVEGRDCTPRGGVKGSDVKRRGECEGGSSHSNCADVTLALQSSKNARNSCAQAGTRHEVGISHLVRCGSSPGRSGGGGGQHASITRCVRSGSDKRSQPCCCSRRQTVSSDNPAPPARQTNTSAAVQANVTSTMFG